VPDEDPPSTSQRTTARERAPIELPPRVAATSELATRRAELARTIPRRPRVSWWVGMLFAFGFALLVMPAITAERWLASLGAGDIAYQQPAGMTVRIAPFAGQSTPEAHIGGGGIVIARGELADRDQVDNAHAVMAATPAGPLPYLALFALVFVFGAIFTHHMQRSTKGRLVRVQLVSLGLIAALAVVVKVVMLTSALSLLVVPVALLAMVPTMVLDRVVGLATGILAALVTSLLIPFDVGVAILLLVQAAVAGLVVAEHPKERLRAALTAGAITTVFTASTYFLLTYLTTGAFPAFADAWRSPLVAAAVGPALATLLVVPLLPLYQLLVGEITQGKLIALEDLSNPLLRQIAEKAPGTWQHSLMMANMAEIAANAIGASGRLVRVGAYYHDLGKSLQPKYFIENLEPGETSPHDQLPPEVSCDAIFAHVTEGIVTARKAGLHERIVDFMHMHHGNGVLEYFWSRCRDQGNPKGFGIDDFRYPGHPPQTRETAILTICDAVEAASRTLKKPDAAAIDSLVQRIVYGKLHLGQLDESGLSMSDLRRISDSLRETIRHANHGRIEYPWQKAQQDASAGQPSELTSTAPRLDSLDRKPQRDTAVRLAHADADGTADTAPVRPRTAPQPRLQPAVEDAPRTGTEDLAIVETAPALASRSSHEDITQPRPRAEAEELVARSRTFGEPEPLVPARVRATTDSEEFIPSRTRTPSDGITVPPAMSRTTTRDHQPPRPRTESQLAARPPGPAPDAITPATLGEPARQRAATLPPVARTRAPSVQVPIVRPPTMPPPIPSATNPERSGAVRTAGPPPAVDLENAVTNPPPMRRTMQPPLATRLPAMIVESHGDDDARVTAPRPVAQPVDDAGATAPGFATIRGLPLSPWTPEADITRPADKVEPDAAATLSGDPLRKAVDLAARIDAALERDEWSAETPVVAPTKAELRALLGTPDPTRQQSIEEIDQLHLAAAAQAAADLDAEPELLPRRNPAVTTEVDPEDIEAAIELAPPARRNVIAVAKPKKPTP